MQIPSVDSISSREASFPLGRPRCACKADLVIGNPCEVFSTAFQRIEEKICFKGRVHPTINILSLFTHVVLNPYAASF